MPTGRLTIGVLDDEPEMRKALYRLLTCRGYRVQEYKRGEELLDNLGSPRPDCLLLDLQLDGLNGFEVLEALLLNKIRLPVIVITAHDEPGTADRVRGLGALAYLRKPVDRDILLSSISAALSHEKSPL